MKIEKKDGQIRFLDTEGISDETWNKFYLSLKHLGYGLYDTEDVKRYFNRGTFLNTDQSDEVLRILKKKPMKPRYTEKRIEKANNKAKELFGITDRFDIAGYVLTDGDLLSLTYDGIHRNRDHREISEAVDAKTDSGTDDMILFINYGNIRLQAYGFETSTKPTPAQRQSLAPFIRRSQDLYIDISNQTGQVVQSFEFHYADPSEVFDAIDSYFDALAA